MGILIKSLKIGWTSCLIFILLVMTAEAASDSFAKEFLAETNLARTQPHRYAGYLQEFRKQFTGKNYRLQDSAALVRTSEGVAAVDEGIRFLSEQTPVPPLAWSQGLAYAAADLVGDQGKTGELGHQGSTSGNMQARIERHGSWSTRIAENIGYGPSKARLMVISLIVDDGVPGRGHRTNIFTPSLQVAGAACGSHPVYRNMCVMDFAGGYQSRGKRL